MAIPVDYTYESESYFYKYDGKRRGYEWWPKGGDRWYSGSGSPGESPLLRGEAPAHVVTDGTSDQAFKTDAGKPRFDLLMDGMPNALLDVAKVLTWAIEVKGYVPHSWKEVPDAKRRYRAALHRHENAIARGEVLDPESGLPHRAHVNCCALFLAELDHTKE